MVFSDFDGIDDHTHRHLSGIAQHNDLILMLVHDPIARDLAAGQETVIGDSVMQAEIDLGASAMRDAVGAYSRERLDRIFRWQQEINLSVLPLSSGEETLPQIRQLMGRLEAARRVR
jgi:hypothetical protein